MAENEIQRVVVTDIDVPFWEWVGILVTIAIAAIPAAVIAAVIYVVLAAILGGLLAVGGGL